MFDAYRKEVFLVLIFAVMLTTSGVDLVADLYHGVSLEHVFEEAIIIVMSLFAVAWILVGLYQQKLEITELKKELESIDKTRLQPKKYVLEARKNLSNVVTQQFSEWGLTESESDIGWLLLKGLSLKEIAVVRNTLEKTVRQQASSIYKKSGVPGRHVFSAWFIEDIL